MKGAEARHANHHRNQLYLKAGMQTLGAESGLRVGSAVIDYYPVVSGYVPPYEFRRSVVTLEAPPTYSRVGQAYIYYRLGDTGFYPEIRLSCYEGLVDFAKAKTVFGEVFYGQRVSVRIHEVGRGQRLTFPQDLQKPNSW